MAGTGVSVELRVSQSAGAVGSPSRTSDRRTRRSGFYSRDGAPVVGRSRAVAELSRSVDCGGSGKLCRAVAFGAKESGAIPAGSGKVPPRSSAQEQRWRMAARRWTGDAGPAAGLVAFSPRIRGDQLRKRDVAVPHAALHVPRFYVARCRVPRFNAERFRNGIPFPERAVECGRTVLPRLAEN